MQFGAPGRGLAALQIAFNWLGLKQDEQMLGDVNKTYTHKLN